MCFLEFMALVTMKELLDRAEEQGVAVGAFSVGNMEMVMGAVKAAEELETPIILQIAEVRLPHSPLELMGPMMLAAAENAAVDIAVHLDHGLHPETVAKALDIGFTSVMFDGSQLPLEKNIEIVKNIVHLASEYDATVEAELGVVGGESGVAGLAGLIKAAGDPRLRQALKLDAGSRVLCYGTEGATDPENYRKVVWEGSCGSL